MVDEPAARWVRWIVAEYAGGTPLNRLRMRLNELHVPTPSAYFTEQGWPTPRGRVATRWALSTLDRILHDPAYVGRHSAYRNQEFKPTFRSGW